VSYVFKSLYVHVNTSQYYMNRQIKACRSFGVQHVPKFTYFGSLYVPNFIFLCISVELWVLVFLGPLKWFCKS